MGTTHNAHVLFRQLPDKLKAEVFEIAAGKLVYFPSKNQRTPVDKVAVCEQYGNGDSLGEIAESFGVSRARVWQILQEERSGRSKGRIRFWREQGLSLREIARLYKKSHEAVRYCKEKQSIGRKETPPCVNPPVGSK